MRGMCGKYATYYRLNFLILTPQNIGILGRNVNCPTNSHDDFDLALADQSQLILDVE
jgi:hypothetical protein